MSYATFFKREIRIRPYGLQLVATCKNVFADKSALYKIIFLLLALPAAFPILSIINILAGRLVVAISLFELMRAFLFEGIVLIALLLYVALAWRESKHGSVSKCAFVTKSHRRERGEGKKSQAYTEYLARFFGQPQPRRCDCSRNGIRKQTQYTPFFTRTHLYIFGFGALLFVLSALSSDLRAGIFSSSSRADGLFFLFHVSIYILLLSWIVQERRQLELLFTFVVALGVLSALGAFSLYFWQTQNNPGIQIQQSIEIILGNTGFFAHYLLIIFFTNLYFIIVRPRVWNIVALATVALAVFFTFSSTALGIVAIACAILLFIIARFWFYGMLGFGFFAWWYGLMFNDAFLAQLVNPFTEAFIRGTIWKDTVQLVSKYHPVGGFGWGNTEIMWNNIQHDSWAASGTPWSPLYFDKTHNVILEFFSAAGILGVAALILFWARIIRRVRRLMAADSKGGIFLIAAFGAHLLYLQFNFDTAMSYILVSIWLVSFLIFTQEKAIVWPRVGMHRTFKWIGSAVLCVSLLTALWYLNFRPLYAFFSATQVQGDAGRIPVTTRALDLKVAQFTRARDQVGFQKSILNEVGMAFKVLAARFDEDAERLPDFIQAMRANSDALISAHPLNPFYYYWRAQVEQEIAKDSSQSVSYLKQAIALAPGKGIFRFQLGIVYLQAGKNTQAREIFSELKQDNWFPGAMDLYLAIVDFLDGEQKRGKKKFLSALVTYTPTAEIEWNMLAGAYLVHGNPVDLMVWFQEISKLIGPNKRLNEIMLILEGMVKEPQSM